MENSMEVLQKIKNRTTILPNNPTSEYLPEENKNIVSKETPKPMCYLSHDSQQENNQCSSRDEWVDKGNTYTHIME